MNKSISWKNSLYIALVCFALKFTLFSDGIIITFALEVIGLISLVSGIAGYIKYKKSLKNIQTPKENK